MVLEHAFYRETVQDSGVGDVRVIRQQLGTGVYAGVRIAVRGLSRGQGSVFAWNAGLNFPARFASAVLLGVQRVMDAGVLAGLEVTDIHVSVEGGSYHEEDSTVDAFSEAAEKATIEAIRQARPLILEALSLVTIAVSRSLLDAVEATVTSHGGETKAIRFGGTLSNAWSPHSDIRGEKSDC